MEPWGTWSSRTPPPPRVTSWFTNPVLQLMGWCEESQPLATFSSVENLTLFSIPEVSSVRGCSFHYFSFKSSCLDRNPQCNWPTSRLHRDLCVTNSPQAGSGQSLLLYSPLPGFYVFNISWKQETDFYVLKKKKDFCFLFSSSVGSQTHEDLTV